MLYDHVLEFTEYVEEPAALRVCLGTVLHNGRGLRNTCLSSVVADKRCILVAENNEGGGKEEVAAAGREHMSFMNEGGDIGDRPQLTSRTGCAEAGTASHMRSGPWR